MKKPTTLKIYRQGDVLLRLVCKLPSGEHKQLQRDKAKRGFVLAYGEVTGHAHVVDSPHVDMVEISGVTYIDIYAAMAELKHEEHATIKLPRGTYEIIHQREYSPEQIRRVAD